MAGRLTARGFHELVAKSGLVAADVLESSWSSYCNAGGPAHDPDKYATALIKKNLLTPWQAEKLLQGKHKGFFLGKYRLLSHLGSGGMSSVFLAEHLVMRRRVAIKVLPQSKVGDSSYLERFHREAQAVAALDDPNIVRAYDVDQEGNIHFLVMEYVPGQSLQEMVRQNGPLEVSAAVEYTRQAAEGLQHAHDLGMIHRDVKPGNLLADPKGTVKLADLGLAMLSEQRDVNPLTIRHDEKVLGTADYVAPEQALDSHSVDCRADIYSLGATLYFLLTGSPPFPDGTLAQRLLAHQSKEPVPLEERRPDVGPALARIIRKMMAKKPDDRFQTARDVASALADWLVENGSDEWKQRHEHLVARHAGTVAPNGEPAPQAPAPPAPAPAAAPAAPPTTRQHAAAPQRSASPAEPARLLPAAVESPGDSDDGMIDFFRELSQAETKRSASSPTPPPQSPSPVPAQTPRARPAAFPPAPQVDLASLPDLQAALAAAAPNAADARRQTNPAATGSLVTASLLTATGLALVVALIWLVWNNLQPTPQTKNTAKPNPNKSPGGDGADSGTASPAKSASADTGRPRPNGQTLERKLTVGPAGQFPTLAAALNDVRAHAVEMGRSRNAWQIIEIEGGAILADALLLDARFPVGVKIVAVGDPAVLKPPGTGPVIHLDGKKRGEDAGLERLEIENLIVDASNRDVAVLLEDWLDRVALKNLRIVGFKKRGLEARGAEAFSNSPLNLSSLRFLPGDPAAVGIAFLSGTNSPAQIDVNGCRFLGPLAAGIAAEERIVSVTIRDSIFDKTQYGIRLAAPKAEWRSLRVGNNTFLDNEHAIHFSSMPAPGTADLAFHHNLFVHGRGPDLFVAEKLDLPAFYAMFSNTDYAKAENLTTRPVPPDHLEAARTGEVSLYFNSDQQAIPDPQFFSTDADHPRFLSPGLPAVKRRKVGPSHPYAGAVPP